MVFVPVLESSGLSLHSLGPPVGEVNDARVGSGRDCFRMSLLHGDVFSCGVVRGWSSLPPTSAYGS
jgi:hypothetical protein